MQIPDKYSCIKISEFKGVFSIQIDRPEANNSINAELIGEMMDVLLKLEALPDIKVIVLEGTQSSFCTGMDFKALSEEDSIFTAEENPGGYYSLLTHFSLCSKIVVAKVEGKVNAGGIGLVAASDIVIADEKVTFGLSEALFGLIPAMVMPFLIRRIGFQKALWMTLITQGISAERAFQTGLVDEITNNINETMRKNLLRLTRLDTHTILELKSYMSKLWIINDQTQTLAVNTITNLLNSEKVKSNIINYVQNGKFPWDK